jgi:hypothetical protein
LERPDIGHLGENWPERPYSGRQAKSGQNGRIPVVLAEFWPVGRNPANPDSDKIVQILAFISDSGYSSQNSVKVV